MVRAFDVSGDGSISINEFIRQLRGNISERRVALIQQAWMVLDTTGSNAVPMSGMMSMYDVRSRPEVIQGRMSEQDAMVEFMSAWNKNGDSVVTWDEFIEYYMDISATIQSDDMFDTMVRNAWYVHFYQVLRVYCVTMIVVIIVRVIILTPLLMSCIESYLSNKPKQCILTIYFSLFYIYCVRYFDF